MSLKKNKKKEKENLNSNGKQVIFLEQFVKSQIWWQILIAFHR